MAEHERRKLADAPSDKTFKTQLGKEIKNYLLEKHPALLFVTKIRNYTKIKESIGEGIGIIDYAPGSAGAADFEKLAREVIDRESKR